MADAAGLLDARGVAGAAAAAGRAHAPAGDIVVPLGPREAIDLEALDAEKQRLLEAAWDHGTTEGKHWVVGDPELGDPELKTIANGLVVVQGKFQPPTFGHELMVSFAKGFSEGASSGRGNWPLRYAIFPISAASQSAQAIAGKVKSLLPAPARIGAWEGVQRKRARGGGAKRGAEEAGNDDCTGLCRRFFREDCDLEPGHIVMIVGSDAAAAEYTAEFIGDTPAAQDAAAQAAATFAEKTAAAAASGRNAPRPNTCLSVYPFGAYRPPEIPSAEALGRARKAIATGAPVAISATLARAAAVAGDEAVLEVTRPVSEGPALLHRQYLDWYPTVNREIAEHPHACPFCGEAFALSKGKIVKKWCKAHFESCPEAPRAGGTRRARLTRRRKPATVRRRARSAPKRAARRSRR